MARTPDQSRPITPPIGPASEYDGPKRPSVATVVQTEHPLGSRWRKRSPRKSRDETGPENAALSAPPGRLVLHPTPAKPRKLGRKPGLVSSLSRLGSLLGGGRRPEQTGLVPSMRLLPLVGRPENSREFVGVRGSSWELGALGEPSLDFAPGVRLVLGGRLSQTERSSAQAGRMFRGGGCGPPGSSRHDQLLAESHTISPSRTALLRLTGTLYRALEPRLARELASLWALVHAPGLTARQADRAIAWVTARSQRGR